MNCLRRGITEGLLLLAISVGAINTRADMTITPWVPVFKGIDHATGTNKPSSTYPNLNVIHAIRVDLQDPDIQFYTSPRMDDYIQESRETAGYTVSDFLRIHQLQLAVNANLFDPSENYLPAGTPMDIDGLSICQGDVVSPQENSSHAASVTFTSNNVPNIIYTNWPAHSNAGVYTAVSGDYCVLVKGVNVGYQYRSSSGFIHQTNPRTAFGISQDKRYFFILTIDGRQSGYSVGALDFETGAWLLLIGAYDGVDMDGGGSTTLVVQNSVGEAVRLNRSSTVADSGKERTVGSHFGIYAKPVPEFINDVTAVPNDRTAVISWTTIAPANGHVQYGLTTNFTDSSVLQTDLTTNHSVTLAGLDPATTYYYQISSGTNDPPFTSPAFVFTTTNYVTTNVVFGLDNSWKYSTANLDGVNWTALNYDDSGWSGPSPGILWADARGANSGIANLQTSMPIDPSTGFPYPTYYFRTYFNLTNVDPGISLYIEAFLDDGAVFYVNGAEVYRMRMADAPAPISYSDLSVTYGCDGDATCPEDFALPKNIAELLHTGQNVLAVEAHNYNARSPDITFGASLTATVPINRSEPPTMQISFSPGAATLTWSGDGFTLEEADSPAGPWTNVPGSPTSPWQVTPAGQAHYYRLSQ